MRLQRYINVSVLSLAVAISVGLSIPRQALAQAPTVSTVTLQVVPGPQGSQCVITPKGMTVPLPGAGVNSNVVLVYMGSQGGYWYVDKNGQTVDLTAAVQQLQGSAMRSQQVPQYAPAPYYGSSSGSSGLATAAAAGLGAMTGAAIAGSSYYNNVPYGTPVYYPRGGNPYYVNASGNNVNVEHSTTVNNTANVSNTAYNDVHANNLQKQQDWYANQHRQQTDQFKAWQQNAGNNPFVNEQAGGAFRRGQAAGADDGAGRFGRRRGGDDQGGDGGRFGRRRGDGGDQGGLQGLQNGRSDQQGGRFGRRRGGDQDGPGGFQGGDGRRGGGDRDGGGRFQRGTDGPGGGDAGGGRRGRHGH